MSFLLPYFYCFIVAGLGVGIFQFFSLPLPWLLGPIFACLLSALLRVPMKGVKLLNDSMRTVLGVAVGASFTPVLLMSIVGIWPTLLLLSLMTVMIGLIGVPYFRKIWGFDFPTSYYAAMPGGLQDMLSFGEEAGGNVRTLSLIHATRVLVIVVALPFLLQGIWGADLDNPPGVPITAMSWDQMAIMFFCAFGGWWLAHRVGMFGATILGPLIMAAIFALSGLLDNRPPAEAIWMAQFFIGMTIGVKYSGITVYEVKRDVTAGLGLCVILIVLTLIFAELIFLLDLAPPMETLLAFAPGGQAELTVLALIVGADAAFVIAHHVLRIFLVILGAPVFARLYAQTNRD